MMENIMKRKEDLLSVDRAADILGITPRRIRHYTVIGLLPTTLAAIECQFSLFPRSRFAGRRFASPIIVRRWMV
jgi:hypothetical protein